MKRILVVRNDKIGDFMLAWPSFAMLKRSMECHVTALVPAYTAPLARLCPWIDEIILDPGARADKEQQRALLARIKAAAFDASICLFSNTRNAKLVWKAHIPYRLAPATKLAQVCNLCYAILFNFSVSMLTIIDPPPIRLPPSLCHRRTRPQDHPQRRHPRQTRIAQTSQGPE